MQTKTASDAIQAALLNITAYGQPEPNSTTFLIDVYSTYEKSSLFNYHYTASAFVYPIEGVTKVNSNTTYCIGSVSRLLTVHTISRGGWWGVL